MTASAETLWNNSNQTKITLNKNNNCSYLAITEYGHLNLCTNEWEWWSSKVSASKIWNDYNCAKIKLFSKNNCSYLAVTNDVWLHWSKKEWEWWSLKVSKSKICNDPNKTKITFNPKKTAIILLLSMMLDGINAKMNEIDEVWRQVYQKYVMIQIRQELH